MSLDAELKSTFLFFCVEFFHQWQLFILTLSKYIISKKKYIPFWAQKRRKKRKDACFVSYWFLLFYLIIIIFCLHRIRESSIEEHSCTIWASIQMDTLITSYCFFLSMSRYINLEKRFILYKSCYGLLTLLGEHILVHTAECISLRVRTVFIKLSNKRWQRAGEIQQHWPKPCNN